jgi:biotin carboxyl carrier protein
VKTLEIQLNGREHTFDVAHQRDWIHVVWAGKEWRGRVVHHDDHFLVLEIEGPDGSRCRLQIAGSADGKEQQVWVSGRLLRYERVQPQRQRPTTTDSSLAASIPAVVSHILVAPGDEVRANDKLILLESMKMIIPIQAPYNGLVRRLNCAVGDSVPAGVPLLELEPSSGT